MSNQKHLQDLKEIRSMMEHSTRFLSLSGLSGILAGIYSLIGAYYAWQHYIIDSWPTGTSDYLFFGFVALMVMLFSLLTGFFLTARAAKKNNQSIFTKTALRMMVHIGFPLLIGAVFTGAMLYQGKPDFIAAGMLIFYGLGLINGGKYTHNDIRMLGILNVIIGLFALFFVQYSLQFWALSFGVMHIIYGVAMWYKYEK